MSTLLATPKPATSPTAKALTDRVRGWLNPLNLHVAGVALLLLVNLYLLIHMAVLWGIAGSNNDQAVDQQKIALKTADIAAQPLRGLDAKLDRASTEADKFYKDRLPARVSDVAAELGTLTKKQGVHLIRSQYVYAPVLAGSPAELTEMRIDAGLSGDYRPLVQFINSLERDQLFFVIDSVIFTGQQSGAVNLRLHLRTYLRGRVPAEEQEEQQKAGADASGADTKTVSETDAAPVNAAPHDAPARNTAAALGGPR
jgi:hypothetical protein